ncbi:hypothetical protein EW093_06980 [Thiospirochaeta perfilievii]|uniref:DUF2178 domain-containing protein n=1 Tax=Thiospirochaeta perfilievii TaxID=252967 RepID=A0A5C1QE24_9SPIO|nr:hypothetical protein [Thiospirochaeta perfilievii]QEN04452.1 hypothetical protein EW093_06980 [Thiospirochaeta perfilievii]
MNKMSLKKRVTLIGIVNVLVVLVLVLFFNQITGFKSEYIRGMGVGCLVVILPFLIFLIVVYKNREYKEDYDISRSDERIIRNYERAGALSFRIQSMLIIAVAIISFVLDVDLYFLVLGVVFVTVIFGKIYGKKLNSFTN